MRRRSPCLHTALAVLLGLSIAFEARSAGAATPPPPATRSAAKPTSKPAPAAGRATAARSSSSKSPLLLAQEARSLEELGVYSQAADVLAHLALLVPDDADLQIQWALDLARSGRLDSAAVRLWSPLLTSALGDSTSAAQRHRYLWGREELWINRRFDGWHWYVARARAEVAASLSRWQDALEAARTGVQARPLAGKEWLILAVAAGRAGNLEEAQAAARRALELDPSLPEAHYLHGLYEWKAGRRAVAQTAFRKAVELDSSYRAPALALVRSKLPGAAPDSLPTRYLNGTREIDLLTSAARPKPEESIQKDAAAQLLLQIDPVVPDSLKGTFKEVQLSLGVLIDERGRIALHDMSSFNPALLPEPLVGLTTAQLPHWRFKPATRHGVPQRVWSLVMLRISPE